MSNHRDTSFELRDMRLFSGSDQFMQGGHQIINRNLANARGKRKSAPWALNDVKIQKILLRAFPKLEKDENQRQKAGRWLRMIHLFYRAGMSYGDVAAELGEKVSVVKRVLQSIRRCANGMSCNKSKKPRAKKEQQISLGDL